VDISAFNLYPTLMGRVLGDTVTSNFNQIFSIANPFHITGRLYFSDILDILIITAFLYSLFLLFKRTRSFLIILGLSFVVLLYVFAKLFNLYLTTIALNYFFGVFVIVFAIIFQNEIRKFFEFVGLISTRRLKVKTLSVISPLVSEILQACVKMAQSKTGALIVLQGKDVIDPFIEGGIDLDGNISEEVLLSIFDPHSEGHDGALIISNNRIYKFGTHLPLSNNFKEIGKHGTRHSAALGLSEISDAFSIVISEEKGTISVCRDGRLKKLENYSDLEKELEKFLKDKFYIGTQKMPLNFLRQNLGLKTASLATASLLWFFTAYQTGIVKKTYTIPVEFDKLPSYSAIEDFNPKQITLTVSGRGDVAFSGISDNDFQMVIDASSLQDGVNKFILSPQLIKVPLNLTLNSIDSNTVLLTAKKYSSYTLPVKVATKGTPPRGFSVSNIAITPEQVELWIPQTATAPAEIATTIVDLIGQKESFVTPVKLVLPANAKLVKPEINSVSVAVTIGKP
jgi:diadenylate cyclase